MRIVERGDYKVLVLDDGTEVAESRGDIVRSEVKNRRVVAFLSHEKEVVIYDLTRRRVAARIPIRNAGGLDITRNADASKIAALLTLGDKAELYVITESGAEKRELRGVKEIERVDDELEIRRSFYPFVPRTIVSRGSRTIERIKEEIERIVDEIENIKKELEEERKKLAEEAESFEELSVEEEEEIRRF